MKAIKGSLLILFFVFQTLMASAFIQTDPSIKNIESSKTVSRISETWIFLHGLGDAPTTFDDLQTNLSSTAARIIAPDLSLLTSELMADGAYSHAALAKRVVDNIPPELLLGHVFVLGHSMGVQVGLEVSKLIRIDGFVSMEGSLTPGDEKALKKYVCTPGTDDGWTNLLERQRRATQEDRVPPSYRKHLAKTPAAVYCAMVGELVKRRAEYTKQFIGMKVPHLQIAGELSNGPLLLQEPGVNDSPHLQIVVVKDAKHWVHIDQPDKVWQIIREWKKVLQKHSLGNS